MFEANGNISRRPRRYLSETSEIRKWGWFGIFLYFGIFGNVGCVKCAKSISNIHVSALTGPDLDWEIGMEKYYDLKALKGDTGNTLRARASDNYAFKLQHLDAAVPLNAFWGKSKKYVSDGP